MEVTIQSARRSADPFTGVEVVERKGLGHPDTICDGIAEHVSVRLCRYYLEHFGAILHHNVDKVLLCGGASRPAFGGGEVVEPIEIYLAGRATTQHEGERIPAHDIAIDACREWLREHVPELSESRNVRVVSRIRPGSTELTALFARSSTMVPANDTSCGSGFAPFTALERLVLATERCLNSAETKARHPEIGRDVKVMGVRKDRRAWLTIACALIDRHVRDLPDYAGKVRAVRELALDAARKDSSLDVEVRVNAADDMDRGEVFLTVTGTSAEAGDDGEVGRGNRACGLITPYRPMTLEAVAGKNPVTHVGKLYNIVAGRVASAVVGEIGGVQGAECILVSRIGAAITEPQIADVRLTRSTKVDEEPRDAIVALVRDELANLGALRDALVAERVAIY